MYNVNPTTGMNNPMQQTPEQILAQSQMNANQQAMNYQNHMAQQPPLYTDTSQIGALNGQNPGTVQAGTQPGVNPAAAMIQQPQMQQPQQNFQPQPQLQIPNQPNLNMNQGNVMPQNQQQAQQLGMQPNTQYPQAQNPFLQQQPAPQQQQLVNGVQPQYQQQGQQQMQGQGQPQQQQFDYSQLDFRGYQQQGVEPEMVDYLIEEAENNGVPPQNMQAHLNDLLQQGIGNFGDVHTLDAYRQAEYQLYEALNQSYGEQAPQVIEQAFQRIYEQGGEPLVQKFSTDPTMLQPEIIGPYLTGNAQGPGNPYQNYFQQNNRGLTQPPTPQQNTAMGNNPNELNQLRNYSANPNAMAPESQVRKLELMVKQNQMNQQPQY